MGDVPYDFNMTRLNRDKLGRAALSTLLSLAFFGMGATGLGGCSDDEEDKKADEPVEPADDSGGDEVILHTSMGDITIELLEEASPIACKNFVSYAEEGFYDGTIFHRVIPGFAIQAGGYTPMLAAKSPKSPIKNEAKNFIPNKKARWLSPDENTKILAPRSFLSISKTTIILITVTTQITATPFSRGSLVA